MRQLHVVETYSRMNLTLRIRDIRDSRRFYTTQQDADFLVAQERRARRKRVILFWQQILSEVARNIALSLESIAADKRFPTSHHIYAVSSGGNYSLQNIACLWNTNHSAWHAIFGLKTPVEIIVALATEMPLTGKQKKSWAVLFGKKDHQQALAVMQRFFRLKQRDRLTISDLCNGTTDTDKIRGRKLTLQRCIGRRSISTK